MILTYENTLDDMIAFTRYHQFHSPSFKRSKISGIFLIWALLIGSSLVLDQGPFGREALVVATVLYVLGCLLFFRTISGKLLALQVRRMYNEGKNKAVLCRHELEATESGMIERTEVSEAFINWSGIERIEEDDEFAFIYVASVMAHVVPKHRVIKGDSVEFIAHIKQMWHTANRE